MFIRIESDNDHEAFCRLGTEIADEILRNSRRMLVSVIISSSGLPLCVAGSVAIVLSIPGWIAPMTACAALGIFLREAVDTERAYFKVLKQRNDELAESLQTLMQAVADYRNRTRRGAP